MGTLRGHHQFKGKKTRKMRANTLVRLCLYSFAICNMKALAFAIFSYLNLKVNNVVTFENFEKAVKSFRITDESLKVNNITRIEWVTVYISPCNVDGLISETSLGFYINLQIKRNDIALAVHVASLLYLSWSVFMLTIASRFSVCC